MQADKLKQFNVLNQKSADSKYFICEVCKHWLTKEIYLHTDGKNYCPICAPSKKQRNEALEQILLHQLFPCKFNDCDFILKPDQIENHVLNCEYAPVNCNLCEDSVNIINYREHLIKKHNDKILLIDKPIFEVNSRQTTSDMSIVLLNEHVFLIHVYRTGVSLTVNMAKMKNMYDRDVSNYFTIYCKSETGEHIFKKRFVDCSQIQINQNVDINTTHNLCYNLDIFLCDYEKLPKLNTCPICEEKLPNNIIQCANGHNICAHCGTRMNNCAVCRDNHLSTLNLKFLFEDAIQQCPNVDKGCLVVAAEDNMSKHMKRCCYVSSTCGLCDKQFSRSNLFSHMKEKHRIWKNFEVFKTNINNASVSSKLYFCFKNHLFFMSCQSNNSKGNKKIGIRMQLCDSENDFEAEKYKFEFHVLHQDKTVHFLRGICQGSKNSNSSLSISYDSCEKYFVEENNFIKMQFRIVIIEVGDSN